MAESQRNAAFDDIDEAEEEALLKSDDESNLSPKTNSKDLEAADCADAAGLDVEDEDSLMLDDLDSAADRAKKSSIALQDNDDKNDEDVETEKALLEKNQSDSSDDDDDAEDDDDDDDESEDAKILQEFCETLKELEENPYMYDKYLHLCELAHAGADLENIRQAYKIFSSVYPLSPELWSKYLQVETSVAQSEKEIDKVFSLYSQAFRDYYSIDLALELVALLARGSNPTNYWLEMLSTYGVNCLKGHQIFEAFREYTENHSVLSEEEKDHLYVESYIKELRLPLCNMEKSFIDFKVYVTQNLEKLERNDRISIDMDQIEADYYRAKVHLQKILVYERQLEALDAKQYRERFEVYKAYVEDIDKYLNENIIQTVYERMVTDCCLNEEAWLLYIEFIEYRQEIQRSVELDKYHLFRQRGIDVNRRALRNCVWSDKLYIMLMQLLEKNGLSRENITSVLESAISVGFSSPEPLVAIWLEYLTYLRRSMDWKSVEDCENLRKNFDYAWNYLSRQWDSSTAEVPDPNLEILKLWGRLEYGPLQDPAEGKVIWNSIMGNPENASRSGLWIEFAQLELRIDLNATRHIYRTAIQQSNLDNPFAVASAWERFERCNGSMKNLIECKKLCSKVLEEYQVNSVTAATPQSPKKSKFNKKPGTKRKANDDDEQEMVVQQKKSKDSDQNKEKSNVASTSKKEPAKERGFKDHENHEIDMAKDHLRIFLSNLDYNLTEEDIKEGLKDLKIVSVDLIRSANGKSRGFGYLELESPMEVAKALKMDGTALHGRPLYISSVLRDKQQRQKFKYSDSVEPKKLFVKSLPPDTTKEELQAIFGVYGELLDVRLVYQKSGKFKNIAYVEYKEEAPAGKAVLAVNNMELRNHTISVAISAPPPKPSVAPLPTAKLLGFNPKRSKVGEQKPRMSLIPTAVRKKFEAAASTSTNTSASPTNGTSSTSSKSNEDFRKLLLKP